MMQALEFFSPIGLFFTGAGTTLAAVASAFVIFSRIRRAIERQIKAQTTEMFAEMMYMEMKESLARLTTNVEILLELRKAQCAEIAEMRKDTKAAIAEQGKARSAEITE